MKRHGRWGLVVLFLVGCRAEPTAYERASLTRGGRLYDDWMEERGVTVTQPNPGYALTMGKVTDAPQTWRCTECHGWDYRGVEGAYRTGAHFTGVMGVLHARQDPKEELFEVIKNGIEGEAMSAFGSQAYSDEDLWDLVRFLKEGTVELSLHLDPEGGLLHADAAAGKVLFEQGLPGTDPAKTCVACHGADGKKVNFHEGEAEPEYLGTVAAEDPWEFQHHVRCGHPGGLTMPAFQDLGWTLENVLDVLAFVRTLPAQ